MKTKKINNIKFKKANIHMNVKELEELANFWGLYNLKGTKYDKVIILNDLIRQKNIELKKDLKNSKRRKWDNLSKNRRRKMMKNKKLSPAKKAWKTRRKLEKIEQNIERNKKYLLESETCVICKVEPRRSPTAKTCNQHCAGKLAWETRLN